MKKSLFKNFYRTIFRTFPKFISIIFMIALGVMVFVGLKITPYIMRRSVDERVKEGNLYDYKISSNFGLQKEDEDIISNLKNLKDVEYGYSINLKDEEREVDLTIESKAEKISTVQVIEGNDIESDSDILLDERLKDRYKIGDEIDFKNVEKFGIFKDEVKKLKQNKFTVKGFIKSSEVLATLLAGTTENGYLAIISKNSFDFSYYSYAKITFSDLNDLNRNSKEYKKLSNERKTELQDLFKGRAGEVYNVIYSQKRETLDDSKEEVNKNKFDIEESERKLQQNLEKVQSGRKDLRRAFADLNYQKNQFITQITKNKEKLTTALNSLNSKKTELNKNKTEIIEKNKTLIKSKEDIEKTKAQVDAGIKTVNEELRLLEENYQSKLIEENEYKVKKEEINKKLAELNSSLQTVQNNLDSVNSNLSSISAKLTELSGAEQKLNSEIKTLESQMYQLEKQAKQGILKFDEYYAKLVQKKSEVEENNLKLNKGKGDLEDAKEKVLDANSKISDGDEVLSKLIEPNYNIEEGFVSSMMSKVYFAANGIYGVSNVFSLFFYFIALLVSLTTMTRMVDENRIQIGTLKALGYGNIDIAKQYFYYGLLASIIGGIIGTILGFKVISPLVYRSYLKAFIFKKVFDNYYPQIIIVGILIAIFCTAFVSYVTCIRTLKEKISSLMRAKAPESGNFVFLEKIPYIWKELSFLQKATLRNVFRYKLRLTMTIIGVMGCMGLLVLGFGIKDSLDGVSDLQYSKYTKYHSSVIYNPMSLEKDLEKFNEDIKANKDIKESIDVSLVSVNIKSKKSFDEKIGVFTTDNLSDFSKFFGLYNGDKKIEKLDDGIYINRKLAEKFSLSVGDEIRFINNNKEYKGVVAGIFENHVGNFFIMNEKTYEQTFFRKPIKNTKLLILNDGSKSNIEKVINELEKDPVAVKGTNIHSLKRIIDDASYSINSIILVIVICSGFLSIVVLYNLSNINISERKREIATLKVLGFYPLEIDNYIYKETVILTIIGIGLGVFVGHSLHINIMEQLAMDSIRFFNKVKLISYIYSALVTLLFTFVVYFIVKIMLSKVPMIESLKDVE
ncbi:FtsX-like permease family protein [Parvimonas sp. D2]|uniref:FtsX-like permease family protein n=1 Tax=unclassified Parvimonas TaxID=1151464 RepID=UPI002B487A4F|nr:MULTISPECIES: FtsX-like permease family protein [unclassified Parvimonas]MEB3012260.1 FtsX-like permease family protein [Parvimonas sp. D2]MEB3087795.1 FtsX-like permease family protein [Parvimonas sp. D4]